MARPPQALLVDLDATLLDGTAFPDSIAQTCRRLVIERRDLDADRLVRANRDAWSRYWPGVESQWALGTLDSASLRLESWRRTLALCGCHDDALAQLASDTHAALARETYCLFDDAHDLATTAAARGIRLGLLSNGAGDVQRDKLGVLGIADWFEVVVVSGEIGYAKPDPSLFQVALDQLAAPPGVVWHVGDDLQTDVAGARAAKVTAVWLNRSREARQSRDPVPDLEVASLRELADLLRD